MPRPDLKQVPEYFHRYIAQVKGNNFVEEMICQTPDFIGFLEKIPDTKKDFRYAEGKWTIKDILQHIIDAERVFSYRALCFARNDKTPLPSFDENVYANGAKASVRNWTDMISEFKSIRTANEIMFRSFDNEQLNTVGFASDYSTTVNALGFIMVGHINHHVNVIRERYLV